MPLSVNVQRTSIVQSSTAAIMALDDPAALLRRPEIHFEGEVGEDVGGLTREWVEDLALALTDSTSDSSVWETSGGGFTVG